MKKYNYISSLFLFLMLLGMPELQAEIRLPAVFSDHIVLQPSDTEAHYKQRQSAVGFHLCG